ncbi:MAG TPA: DUF305 domain-containing protein [Allosphingosinicella sp.]|nr:DUF305 domain-containing protein [Allosphingosinicella sp.]
MNRRPLILALLVLCAVLAAALLYCALRGPAAPAGPAAPPAGPGAEMMGAMDRMHVTAGKTAMTGDIDRDFVALMVPHHQSAVEMARVYLRDGRDPELRRLAENVVASQEAEIRQMRGRAPASAGAGPAPAESHNGH